MEGDLQPYSGQSEINLSEFLNIEILRCLNKNSLMNQHSDSKSHYYTH